MGICIVAATCITPFSPWRGDEGKGFSPSLSDRRWNLRRCVTLQI